MDLTRALPQIFMIWWGKEFKRLLQELQLEVIMMKCYVDDINWGIPVVAPGTRYVDRTLVIEDGINYGLVCEECKNGSTISKYVGQSLGRG